MEIPTYSMHKNYKKMGLLRPFNPKFLGGRAYKRTVDGGRWEIFV